MGQVTLRPAAYYGSRRHRNSRRLEWLASGGIILVISAMSWILFHVR